MDVFGSSLSWDVPVGSNDTALSSGVSRVSTTSSSPGLSSQTTIEIKPEFDALYGSNTDAWEEYIEYTMIEGLASTGGLYTFLDLIFTIIFGRSVINLLFGGRPISPFGSIALASKRSLREKLLMQYPGLGASDASERAIAVCDFLSDFVVDFGPVQLAGSDRAEPINAAPEPQPQEQPTQRNDADGTAGPGNPTPLE
ncbi:hypothetical protein FRC01_005806 [Tulasnella sp. 417]|nr:hypothetical protein FRC01_005806 [Tulasnella sp. 417]